ncbi:MAG: peroxiredoxin [Candidatus Thorarchaeota archaeon]|jgi:peroxiredoxin Q/BCP
MIKIGDKAPDFKTTTESGDEFSLSTYKGKKVFLYFYPKDNTPGCKAESCSIRDSYNVFEQNDIPVFGVSGGSAKSHQSFKDKNNLPFPLLMDEEFGIAKLYEVYQPKKMYGKEYLGIVRTTFLIDEDGKVEGIFGGPEGIEKVKTKEHADQVIKFWGLKL